METKRTWVKNEDGSYAEVLESAVEPALFYRIERLARDALKYSNNHASVRQTVSELHLHVVSAGVARYGHETADALALSEMLRRTDPRLGEHRPTPKPDPIAELFDRRLLTPEMVSAAKLLRRVAMSFGRLLLVAGRKLEGGGGVQKSKALSPLDIMGESIWQEWRAVYKPWCEVAKLKKVKARQNTQVTEAQIVYYIVVDLHLPRYVEQSLTLVRGTALKVLRDNLISVSSLEEQHKRMASQSRSTGDANVEDIRAG